MNIFNKLSLCLFYICILPLNIFPQSKVEVNDIEIIVYSSDDYLRSSYFLEEDLIYGRSVTFSPGLELICLQDKVKVEINNADTLYTPLDLNNMDIGEYTIKLSKTGFYSVEFKVNIFSGKRTSLLIDLKPYTNLLTLKDLPESSIIYINNKRTDRNPIELPIGINSIKIFAFGYEDFSGIIELGDGESIYSPLLMKSDFFFKKIELSRNSLWKNDALSQQQTTIQIHVSARGDGELVIIDDETENELVTLPIVFDKSTIEIQLNINDLENPLKSGLYTIRLKGNDLNTSDEIETMLNIKEGSKSIWRNSNSGFSGFLYSPSAESLPQARAQIDSTFAGDYNIADFNRLFFPAKISLRVAILDNLEVLLGLGLNISHLLNETAVKLSASGKYLFFKTDGSNGFTLGTALSLTYVGKIENYALIASLDSYGQFTGISLVLPFQYRQGPLLVLIAPEFKISPSFPGTVDGGFLMGEIYMWNYIRGALALDLGEFSTAFSFALQSPSYFYSINKWPLFLGLEFNFMPGKSGFTFAFFNGLKIVENEALSFNSGLSFGFIF